MRSCGACAGLPEEAERQKGACCNGGTPVARLRLSVPRMSHPLRLRDLRYNRPYRFRHQTRRGHPMKVTEKKNRRRHSSSSPPPPPRPRSPRRSTSPITRSCASMGLQVPSGPDAGPGSRGESSASRTSTPVSQQLAVDYLVPFAVDKRDAVPGVPAPRPSSTSPSSAARPFEFQLQRHAQARLRADQLRARVHHRPAAQVRRGPLVDRAAPACSLESYRHRTSSCDPQPLGATGAAQHRPRGHRRAASARENLSTDGRTYILGMDLLPDGLREEPSSA